MGIYEPFVYFQGQFNYANVIVQPLEMGSNLVSVRAKGDIEDYFKHLEPIVISDRGAPLLARQLALHANVSYLKLCKLCDSKFYFPDGFTCIEFVEEPKHESLRQ